MKKNKKQKNKLLMKICSLFCALVVLAAAFPNMAYAETAAEKYKRLKGELEGITKKINSYKSDQGEAEGRKAALVQQKRVIDELVVANKESIAETQVELAAKEVEVSQKREELFKNDELFQKRLVAIYRMNNSSAISSVLSVDSFSELLVVGDALQRISKHDTELLTNLAAQRKALETQQKEIDGLLAELQEKYENLASEAQTLAGNISAVQKEITAAEAEIAAQKQVYGQTAAEADKAHKEMIAEAARVQSAGSKKGDGSAYVGGQFVWPVPGHFSITCQFGSPDPNGRGHRGLDISGNGKSGAPIVACGNGTVITATSHSSYGNYVVIDHGNGVKTLYAHCSSLAVGVGAAVTAGQTIAYVGSTGFSTGPHLHLEVHAPGLTNPMGYLRG